MDVAYCYKWGSDLPCEGAILRGKGTAIVKYRPIGSLPWAVQKRLNQLRCQWDVDSGGSKEACIRWESTLAQPGEYDWTVHVQLRCGLVMVAWCNRADHYIFAMRFLSFFLSFFSSPNLSGQRLDVYHTSTHGVALVRISNAGLKLAARGSLKTQDAKKSPKIVMWSPSHNFVGPYLRN